MESSYIVGFREILSKRQPIAEKQTVEDFLATFGALPPVLGKTQKCALKAEAFRNDGNEIFTTGNYKDAAIIYTRSITMAPPYSKCAALAYANRSAALYKLEAYKECVLDLDRALNLPYPDDLKAKLISRKEAAVSNIDKAKSEKKNSTSIDDLKFAYGESAQLPGASSGIDIVYNPIVGRKLVAKMPLQPGDVLIVQNPFLPVVRLEESLTCCHHCLKESLCLIPCNKCTYEVYCSEKCKLKAYESNHRIECEIQSTLMSAIPIDGKSLFFIQELLLQLRCLIILSEQGTNLNTLLDDVKEIEQNSNPTQVGFTGEQFIGNTRKALLSSLLVGNSSHFPAYFYNACYIVILLRNFTNFFEYSADISAAAKLLVELRHVYIKNYVPIAQFGTKNLKAHDTAPLIHLANHGCLANTMTYNDNNDRIILRALENIKPGDEILYSHTTEYCFAEINGRSGLYRCLHNCLSCQKTITYPIQRCLPIKMDKKLRIQLRQNPYDIVGLWKLMNLVCKKHKPHTLQAEVIGILLQRAYEECGAHTDDVDKLLRILSIQ